MTALSSRSAAIVFVLAFGLAPAPAAQPAGEAVKRIETELAPFDKAIAEAPTAEAYTKRAEILSRDGDHERALADYRKALALREDAATLNSIGVEYYHLGKLDEEMRHYDASLRLDPAFALARVNRAIAYGERGQWKESAADYREAIKLEPKRADLHTGLAKALAALSDQAGAGAEHLRAIKLDPKSAPAFAAYADFLQDSGRAKEAIAAYDRALRLQPTDIFSLIARSELLAAAGKTKQALADLDAASRTDPKSAAVLNARGRYYYNNTEDYKEAIAALDAAIAIDDKLENAYYYRGLSYWELGRHDRALRDLSTSLKLAPDDPITLTSKAGIFMALDDYLLANDYLDAAIAADPGHVEAYEKRAEVRNKLGDEKGSEADAAVVKRLRGSGS